MTSDPIARALRASDDHLRRHRQGTYTYRDPQLREIDELVHRMVRHARADAAARPGGAAIVPFPTSKLSPPQPGDTRGRQPASPGAVTPGVEPRTSSRGGLRVLPTGSPEPAVVVPLFRAVGSGKDSRGGAA